MSKAKKLTELIAPIGTDFTKGDTNDVLSALASLLKRITKGQVSGNPYIWPEVKEALELLAQKQGIKDKYDVDLDKFIKK